MNEYEIINMIIGSFMVLTSFAMVIVTHRTWRATVKSAEATKLQVDAAIKPYLHFRIRPLSDCDDPDVPYPKKSWIRGVGIYVENIGPSPAINFKLYCKIIKRDGTIRSCEKMFTGSRILPMNIYTYPSTSWEEPVIKENDEKIIILTEYKDRLDGAHKQELQEIEIEDRHFKEYSGPRYRLTK